MWSGRRARHSTTPYCRYRQARPIAINRRGLEPFGSDCIRTEALIFCFDAFSSREPVPTSLENALAIEGTVVLVVEGLVKRFGGFVAVNKVSFKVEQGEILGLIGPNGSGKSTIFNMLSGTLPPTAGSILFQGREIGGRPPHNIINQGIGRTFQIPRPFHRL